MQLHLILPYFISIRISVSKLDSSTLQTLTRHMKKNPKKKKYQNAAYMDADTDLRVNCSDVES